MKRSNEKCKNCGHNCHCGTECQTCHNDVCVKCEHEVKKADK